MEKFKLETTKSNSYFETNDRGCSWERGKAEARQLMKGRSFENASGIIHNGPHTSFAPNCINSGMVERERAWEV